MKTFNSIILIILFSNFSLAQDTVEAINTGVTLTVKIDNVRSNEGHVIFSLHTKETFMRGPGIKSSAVVSENGIASAIFENVPAGNYAILVLHDKNDNRQMDFEPNGMPKEDYGASNNALSMGPPQYSDAEFTVGKEDMEIAIRF